MIGEKRNIFCMSVKGFVINNDKVLLVKARKYKILETPGGKITPSENIEDVLT